MCKAARNRRKQSQADPSQKRKESPQECHSRDVSGFYRAVWLNTYPFFRPVAAGVGSAALPKRDCSGGNGVGRNCEDEMYG